MTDVAAMPVLVTVPGMDDVRVAHSDAQDVYDPAAGVSELAVVLVQGYPDAGFQRVVGRRFKEMASVVSWARLIAASGMTAIVPSLGDPVADLASLLGGRRVALWSSSGNAPVALHALMTHGSSIAGAVFCYPFLMDLPGATAVADASATFRFVNACAGRSFEELPADVPIFLARAGADETPRLNESLDAFIAESLRRNLPVTVTNHPAGPHAFDLFDEGERTRAIVRQILGFLTTLM